MFINILTEFEVFLFKFCITPKQVLGGSNFPTAHPSTKNHNITM